MPSPPSASGAEQPTVFGRVFGWGATLLRLACALCLLVMMLSTVADIIGRHFFAAPVLGVVDVVELSLVILVFLGIPLAFVSADHVTVDVLEGVLAPRFWRILGSVGLGVTLVMLVVLLAAMVEPFLDTWTFGDRTMDLRIPKVWHWAPILFGTGVAIAVVAAQVLRRMRRR